MCTVLRCAQTFGQAVRGGLLPIASSREDVEIWVQHVRKYGGHHPLQNYSVTIIEQTQISITSGVPSRTYTRATYAKQHNILINQQPPQQQLLLQLGCWPSHTCHPGDYHRLCPNKVSCFSFRFFAGEKVGAVTHMFIKLPLNTYMLHISTYHQCVKVQ